MKVLSDLVLVLNRYFMATQVCSTQKAISLIYKGHAKVIDDRWIQYTFDQWVNRSLELAKNQDEINKYSGEVRSPNLFIFAPQVIYLPYCDNQSAEIKSVKFSRKSVFLRDEYICQYCGSKCTKNSATVDHIIPRSRGGRSNFSNIVTSCKTCNSIKDDRTPEEAGMNILKKPSTPRWKTHIGLPFSMVKRKYWEAFLLE